MNRRATTEERQDQVVRAVLDLLADTPADRIGTREIARRVGISQPALFRHFRSRDALVRAAVAWTRMELEATARRALGEGGTPRGRAEALARGVMDHARAFPGVPRLLFSGAADAQGRAFSQELRQLPLGLRSVAAELVRDAQREGAVPPSVDAPLAGVLFVALVQGSLLQWILEDRRGAPADPSALAGLWWAGLEAGHPASAPGVVGAPLPGPRGNAVDADPLPTLDVRPLLARGEEPLDAILEAVGRLGDGGMLTVIAPFRPTPLLVLLEARGFRVEVRPMGDLFEVECAAQGFPVPMDLTDLPAPEPMERVLTVAAGLPPGGCLAARIPRVPYPLLAHLEGRDLVPRVREATDGTALLHVRRRAKEIPE